MDRFLPPIGAHWVLLFKRLHWYAYRCVWHRWLLAEVEVARAGEGQAQRQQERPLAKALRKRSMPTAIFILRLLSSPTTKVKKILMVGMDHTGFSYSAGLGELSISICA